MSQSYYLLANKDLNKLIAYPIFLLIFVYSFMFFYYVIVDIVRIFYLQNNKQILDLKVLLVAFICGIFGMYNTYLIRITRYKITSDKNVKLKIAFMSDLHIGDTGMNNIRLKKTIDKINKENVDILILGGDIIEQDPRYFTSTKLNEYFKKINTKYGMYAVLGNHEYYGGMPYLISKTLEENGGIKVLNDDYVEFDNIVLIGREDISKNWFKSRRKDIDDITPIHLNKYNIVIDHNPTYFNEAVNNLIDLQLSGHTHNGQFFPFNLVVKFYYKKPYGLLKEDKSILITSSGLGTWRIPIKLFSKPEIVIVEIN